MRLGEELVSEDAVMLRATTIVLARVEPHPPVQRTLAALRSDLMTAKQPRNVLVSLGEGQPWRPLEEVLSECVDFKPSPWPTTLIVLALGGLGLLMFIGHAMVFGTVGLGRTVLGTATLVATAVIISSSVALRLRPLPWLARAVAGPIAVSVFGFETWAVAAGVQSHRAHARIEAALAHPDTCAFDSIDHDLEEWGSDEERQRVRSARTDCGVAEAMQKYAAACARLIERLDAGSHDAADADLQTLRAAERPTIQRMFEHKLVATDFELDRKDMSCDGALFKRLVQALATSAEPWGLGMKMSESIKAALLRQNLAPAVGPVLAAHAEQGAKGALRATKTADMEDANAFCALAQEFKAAGGAPCTALAKKYRILKAREEAAAKAADAAHDAKEQRCEQLRARALDCSMACMDLDLFDPRAAACESRCNAGSRAAGCE